MSHIPVQPIAVRDTAARFAEYAVWAENTSTATSQILTNRNVDNDIVYPNSIRTLNENNDKNTLFNNTVAKATIIYVIDMSKATDRPGNLVCQKSEAIIKLK